MRRPKWLAALLLALAVAAGFAALGQWQLGHAITEKTETAYDTETPAPLDRVNPAFTPVNDEAAGRIVTLSGALVPGDSRVVGNRMNGGEQGFWVVGHLVTPAQPAGHLAVALGWAPDEATAEAVLARVDAGAGAELALQGRYMPAEAPGLPAKGSDPNALMGMAPAQLANLWAPFEGSVYAGFLVAHDAPAGLDAIDSVPPLPQEAVNWLNLFYAAEWVVFAGFALYFWYRITKDAWEKELDTLEQAEAEAAAAGAEPARIRGGVE